MVPQNLTTAKQTGASEWRGKNVFRRRKIFNTKKKRQSSSSVARHGSSGQISRSPSFPSLAGFSQQRFGHGNSHPSRREVWWLWLQGGCSEVHAISGHIVRHLRVAPCGGVPCPWGRGTETMPQGRTIGRKSPGNGPSYWSKRARDRGWLRGVLGDIIPIVYVSAAAKGVPGHLSKILWPVFATLPNREQTTGSSGRGTPQTLLMHGATVHTKVGMGPIGEGWKSVLILHLILILHHH